MIYKRCPHCGRRIAEGQQCTCGYKRQYASPTGTRSLYHTKRWSKLRSLILGLYSNTDPYAYSHGRIEPAVYVHHIVTAEDDPSRFYDPTNLIPLSRSSHDEIHDRYRQSDEAKATAQAELRILQRHAT